MSVKRCAYVTIYDLKNPATKGVNQKIGGEVSAFTNHGWDVDLYAVNNNTLVRNGEKIGELAVGNRLHRLNPFLKRKAILFAFGKHIKKHSYRFVYIRHPKTTLSFLKFLKTIRSPVIYLEIPTFPYYGQSNSIKDSFVYLIDRLLSLIHI